MSIVKKGGRGMKVKLGSILLILILLLVTYSQIALANAGPITDFHMEQSIIFFDDESNISLVEAKVRFSDFDYSGWAPGAKVAVNYTLENKDDFEKDLTIYFVLPANDERRIRLNGVDITDNTEYQDIKLPDNWEPMSPAQIVNPESKEVIEAYTYFELPPWYSHYNPPYEPKGILIPIKIEGNGKVSIDIEYVSYGGYYGGNYRGTINRIYGFLYYLTPAKFWEGDAKLTLEVEFPPNDDYKFYSNIPLEKNEEGLYQTTLNGIPDNEWHFSFFSTEGLMFGTNNPVTEDRIMFFISALIYAPFLILAFLKKKQSIFWIGHILAGTIYLIYFIKVNLPYSFFPPFLMIYLFMFTCYILAPKALMLVLRSIIKGYPRG